MKKAPTPLCSCPEKMERHDILWQNAVSSQRTDQRYFKTCPFLW
jgi:hypothetical protein